MKALYFCNYWQSRIPKVRHRYLVYIFAFRQYCIPGQDFGSSRLRVGVQIPYPVNKVCVSPISAATFRVKSRIPRWEYPSNERKQVRKNTNKETISQKPLIQIFIYLFFLIVFRDRFWTGHKFVTQTCWLKTWPLLITVLKCHSLYITLLPAIQRHLSPWMRISVFIDTGLVCSGMLRTKQFAIFCRILIFFTFLLFGQTNAEGRKTFSGWVWSVLVSI